MTPQVLNLGTRCRWVAIFILQPFCSMGRNP